MLGCLGRGRGLHRAGGQSRPVRPPPCAHGATRRAPPASRGPPRRRAPCRQRDCRRPHGSGEAAVTGGGRRRVPTGPALLDGDLDVRFDARSVGSEPAVGSHKAGGGPGPRRLVGHGRASPGRPAAVAGDLGAQPGASPARRPPLHQPRPRPPGLGPRTSLRRGRRRRRRPGQCPGTPIEHLRPSRRPRIFHCTVPVGSTHACSQCRFARIGNAAGPGAARATQPTTSPLHTADIDRASVRVCRRRLLRRRGGGRSHHRAAPAPPRLPTVTACSGRP